MDELLHLE